MRSKRVTSCAWAPWCRSNQTVSTGTSVLDNRYEVIIEKPTASVSGMNSERTGSSMMKVGMNTERTQNMARRRAVAVAAPARRAARATDSVWSIWAWVFSIVTTASSTRMPMARANPPNDMTLSVWPASHNPTREPVRAKGMFNSTTITVRTSRRKSKIINPTSVAPIAPSVATDLIAARTVGDSSNS